MTMSVDTDVVVIERSKRDAALALAAQGLPVFPLIENGKLPAYPRWPDTATTDPNRIRDWWTCGVTGWEQDYNIGVLTDKFLIIDIDNKDGRHGDASLSLLEAIWEDLPPTMTVRTPTGGYHRYFRVTEPVRNTASKLAEHIDVRGWHGFVVAPGSTINGAPYEWLPGLSPSDAPIADAPEWLVKLATAGKTKATLNIQRRDPIPASDVVDHPATLERAATWLRDEAPEAIEGAGGDAVTYGVACRVRDIGCSERTAVDLMLEWWNERCSPPWDPVELERKVANAYRYATGTVGSAAPAEAEFTPILFGDVGDDTANIGVSGAGVSGAKASERVGADGDPAKLSPMAELNRDFAFCIAGSSHQILWETRDSDGKATLVHLTEGTFHRRLAPRLWAVDKKMVPISQSWMTYTKRRSYDGIVFAPGREVPGFYNLWHGFAVKASDAGNNASRDGGRARSFIEHVRSNVCRGDEGLARWVLGWLAHMIQRPGEKPLVALVLRGGKGVGKTVIAKVMGELLGQHYLLTANRRYLVGNFNGHMESLLLFALDEAFWSGDKQAEGMLKDLITGDKHLIEHKGHAPYAVANLTRVMIIGNEDWLVPASVDERRFAVVDVSDAKKQNLSYFTGIMDDMRAGGYADLLRYLMDYDMAGIDVNSAPTTDALAEQKEESLDPTQQWVLDSLREGVLQEMGDNKWPGCEVAKHVRDAIRRYCKSRNVRGRLPSDSQIGRALHKVLPGLETPRHRIDGVRVNCYVFPALASARADWDRLIGRVGRWGVDDE